MQLPPLGDREELRPRGEHLLGKLGQRGVRRPRELHLTAGLERDVGATWTLERDDVVRLVLRSPALVLGELAEDEPDPVGVEVADRRAVRAYYRPLELTTDEPAVARGAVALKRLDQRFARELHRSGHLGSRLGAAHVVLREAGAHPVRVSVRHCTPPASLTAR